ncbi:MAG: DUF1674 domain-containing protein [Rhodospirillales bacterium]|nr:DUF1674 domain-containing protein [Rhodospirillales bacterium]MBO6787757.1 DUF1674 domain-containing protein [Rhodospirillales bacterium]
MTDDTDRKSPTAKKTPESADNAPAKDNETATSASGEIGGPEGPEPTRYGDWEKKGRCIDF